MAEYYRWRLSPESQSVSSILGELYLIKNEITNSIIRPAFDNATAKIFRDCECEYLNEVVNIFTQADVDRPIKQIR